MRRLRDLNSYRDRAWERQGYGGSGGEFDDFGGCFKVKSDHGVDLRIIASVGMGWDHVSISTALRCPTWAEMEKVKHLFFKPDETAMQLHVPATDHISVHPHCLHLWRPHKLEIPRPPSIMVGVKAA